MTDISYLTLDHVKRRARVDSENEDVMLLDLMGAAKDVLEGWVGPLADHEREDGSIPDCLVEAMSLLVGHWFEHREATTPDSLHYLPLGFREMIDPYRKWEF